MGNFTLKTDSYLDQFALFKGINKILESYPGTEFKIPSLSQFIGEKLYHEWLDLANLVAEIDNWTESDWTNFTVCMSLAESCKNRVDSISYALEGLGWNFTSANQNQMTSDSTGLITITINVDNISTPPRLDQIKEKLKRCIEYLIIAKDPRVNLNIDTVNMDVSFNSDSLGKEIIATNQGVLLEVESSQDTTIISVHIQDNKGHDISEVSSYWSDEYKYGYDKYNVKIIDEGTQQPITDPSLYVATAYYQVGNPNFRLDTIPLDGSDWVFEEAGVGNNYSFNTYIRQVNTQAAHYIEGESMKFLMAPSDHNSQLRIAEAGVFLDENSIVEGTIYLRAFHVPLGEFSIEFTSYLQEDYDRLVERFNLTLDASRWNPSTKTITVSAPQVRNLGTEFIASNIPEGNLLDTCNECEVRIDSVYKGFIRFRCETIPQSNLTIPMELISTVGMESTEPILVSEDNPIPIAYFDKNEMTIWVVKGAGPMDYVQSNVVIKARHINGTEYATGSLSIEWEEVPQT